MDQYDDMNFNDFDQNERYRSPPIELENTQATLVTERPRGSRAQTSSMPGPSSAIQRPDRSARTYARERAATSRQLAPPDTQMTLVATQKRTQQPDVIDISDDEVMEEVELERHEKRESPPLLIPPPRQQIALEDEADELPGPKATVVPVFMSSTTQRNRATRKTPTNSPVRPPRQIPASSSPTDQTRAAGRHGAVARRGASRKRAMPATPVAREAPYRNTRARSQSIEPAPLPAPLQKSKWKGKTPAADPIEELDEEVEELPGIVEIPQLRERVAESIENESMDQVEDALNVIEGETQNALVANEQAARQEAAEAERDDNEEEMAEEEDDLEEEEEEEEDVAESSEDESQTARKEILERLAKRLATSSTPIGPSSRNLQNSALARMDNASKRPTPAQHLPASLASHPAVSSVRSQRTASDTLTQSQSLRRVASARLCNTTAGGSESEREPFPTPGTRAQGERAVRDSAEKHLPYEPAAGTRASERWRSQAHVPQGALRNTRMRQVTI